jgi:hypothetical protein
MKRTPEMQAVLDKLGVLTFGRTNSEAIKTNTCIKCSKPVVETEFKDALSRNEYSISGLCQACQEQVYNPWREDYED